MEILNFGQLSLAAESEKLPLHYVVMDNFLIKRMGVIPPSDYTIERTGRIRLNPSHKLGNSVGWTTYTNVRKESLGLKTLYIGISKNAVFNEIKSQLKYADGGIVKELKDLRTKHNRIRKALNAMEES